MTKEKKNKPSKELPLGFVDRQEKELLVRDFIISNIKEVMIKYGFQYLETPSFEYSDSIGKFLPDKERPDEGVFSFLKGDKPTNSLPLFFKETVFDTTVETFNLFLISSRYSFGYFIICSTIL